jgi:single-strand DNA-binding protein
MPSYFNAPMLNKVFIVGNVVNDPRISLTTGNRIKVANFRIACGRKFRTKSGVLKEEVCFVSITAWLKLAEICERNLKRGDKVYIEGTLQSKQLNDNKTTIVEILAERVQILTPKKIYTRPINEPEPVEEEIIPEPEEDSDEGIGNDVVQ